MAKPTQESIIDRFVESTVWRTLEEGQGYSELETDGYLMETAWYKEDEKTWVFCHKIDHEESSVSLENKFVSKDKDPKQALHQELKEQLLSALQNQS
jgi:hypothetical protein